MTLQFGPENIHVSHAFLEGEVLRPAHWRLLPAAILVIVVGLADALSAQSTAVVKRDTNLREDPSTYEEPIALLKAGTKLTLVRKTSVERYYKVHTSSKKEGWVYGPNLRIQPEPMPAGVGPAGVGGIAEVPELPECADDSEHSRQGVKTRKASNAAPKALTVDEMLTWIVPRGLPKEARTSDRAIATIEERGDVFVLTGFVRLVTFQADCD